MKIVFAGTPEFAVAPLKKIYERFGVAAILTQPDKPQGRKGILTQSPVKSFAKAHQIPILQPEKLKYDVDPVKEIGADLMVTCAYGQILTQEVLDLFPRGVWNIHASLLPLYRGAAPIPRAIIDGCKETGVTIMKTDVGLDTGDILSQRTIGIGEADTCGTLSDKLSSLGAEMIADALEAIKNGTYVLKKQGEGTVSKKVYRTEADFEKPAHEVSCLIRGLSPAPLAFGNIGGLTINFYHAEAVETDSDAEAGTVVCCSPKRGLVVKCGEGAVRISDLQPAGGKRMKDKDFCNGRKIQEGQRFDKPVL